MLLDLGAVLLGLLLLAGGGEALVRGASGLGRRAGLSQAVVGLTVVSLATSAPEIAVSFRVSSRPFTIDCAVNHCATTPHSQRGLVASDQAMPATPTATTAVPTQRHGWRAGTSR